MKSITERRKFLKLGAGTAGALLLTNPVSKALAASCGITPPQTSGPFYPGENKFHEDLDLTTIPGHLTRALGKIAYVKGRVVDKNCIPIVG
jgi:protocatechuate 3,4-dioxygenase beta subunit